MSLVEAAKKSAWMRSQHHVIITCTLSSTTVMSLIITHSYRRSVSCALFLLINGDLSLLAAVAHRFTAVCFMPNTHRRRDETVELRCVGGVNKIRN